LVDIAIKKVDKVIGSDIEEVNLYSDIDEINNGYKNAYLNNSEDDKD